MFRQLSWSLARLAGRRAAQPALANQTTRMMSVIPKSRKDESDEEFDARYIAYLDRADIDGWELRKAMTDLQGMDLVPEPTIIAAALRACRRVNDFALSVRIMECMHMKCETTDVWPWLLQELRPTLDELGIPTHIELGYDKPELALPSPYEIH